MRRAALLLPLLCLATSSQGGVQYTRATPDAHQVASAPDSATGTIAIFLNADSATDMVPWATNKSDEASASRRINYAEASGSVKWFTDRTGGGGASNATSSAGPTNGTWYLLSANEIAIDSHEVFLDGGSKGTDATSKTPIGIDVTTMGANGANGAITGAFDGIVAWAIQFGSVHTDGQHASLAAGRFPPYEDVWSLDHYWTQGHFDGTTTCVDVVGGQTMTIASGAPTLAPHKNTFVRPGMWQ